MQLFKQLPLHALFALLTVGYVTARVVGNEDTQSVSMASSVTATKDYTGILSSSQSAVFTVRASVAYDVPMPSASAFHSSPSSMTSTSHVEISSKKYHHKSMTFSPITTVFWTAPHTSLSSSALSSAIIEYEDDYTTFTTTVSLSGLSETQSTQIPMVSASVTSTPTLPSTCGESGNFMLNWDDEPAFTPINDTNVPYPPIFNPYHHLYFSNGYVYAPLPNVPFLPVSPPKLAVFFPNATGVDVGSPYAAGGQPGELGAGPRAALNAFWFDAGGAYLGCDNKGPENCTMTIVGYSWDPMAGKEKSVVELGLSLAPCPEYVNCALQYFEFEGPFEALSTLQIGAEVEGQPRAFFMDNLSMSWYNNTCAAGLLRQRSRK